MSIIGPEEQHCQSQPETMSTPQDAIESSRRALQRVLGRLMDQEIDVELQARHVPRVTGALMQAIRTGHQLGGAHHTQLIDEIHEVVGEIEAKGRPDYTIFTGEETS